MNPNYDMKNIFSPGGPQSFNPNPNQPQNEGYPNQGQNMPLMEIIPHKLIFHHNKDIHLKQDTHHKLDILHKVVILHNKDNKDFHPKMDIHHNSKDIHHKLVILKVNIQMVLNL